MQRAAATIDTALTNLGTQTFHITGEEGVDAALIGTAVITGRIPTTDASFLRAVLLHQDRERT